MHSETPNYTNLYWHVERIYLEEIQNSEYLSYKEYLILIEEGLNREHDKGFK